METLANVLEEWLLGILVLILCAVLATSSRAALKGIKKEGRWRVLREMAPSLSNLLYVLGLKVFLDVAPLHGKSAFWIDGSIYVLCVVIYVNVVQKAALIGIEWSTLRAHTSEVLHRGFVPLLKNVTTLFVFFSAGIMILKHFNYDVMSLVTALGVSSLAVGLAAKDTLSNMISGFILIIDRNLRPGDRINLAGAVGDVIEIGLRSTQIKMGDGNLLIVPNSDLVNTKILNLSMPSRETTCTTLIRVPFSIPFSRIKSICLPLVANLKQVTPTKKSWVNLVHLTDGHQLIQIGFWILDMNDSGATLSDFHESLLIQFKQEGIPLVGPPTTSIT